MKRNSCWWMVAVVCLFAPGKATAVIGALDPVPAATLLLPYFEVDLGNPNGMTTIVAVANADLAPVIAHVTLWTDLSVPTLTWNMYLTGYDVVTFSLRDLFDYGLFPSTTHTGPVGGFSLPEDPVTGVGPGSTSCSGQPPPPPLPAVMIHHLRQAHTGGPSPVFGGRCSGFDHGNPVARGYITIDSVSYCTLDFPGEPGYFLSGGLGAANNKNALLGDHVLVNPSTGDAYGETLVHLEADPSLDSGSYTFYRRYSGGTDNREPLPTSYWARFTLGDPFSGGTRLIVWRDSKRTITPFSCALRAPAPFDLPQNQIVVFDEQENPELPCAYPFPWEANSTEVGGGDFPVSPSYGWTYLNLNTPVPGSQVPFEPMMQNYVSVLKSASGIFSIRLLAFPLDNALTPLNVYLPICDGPPDPPGC